jgi:uncharacterized protein YcnI
MRNGLLRVLALGALLTLASSALAWAHAEVTPSEVPAGATEDISLEVVQEKEAPTTEVRMEIPEGFEVTGVAASGGWQGEAEGNAVVWSGRESPRRAWG